MNTRRNATRRLEEKIANVGAPPRGKQVPPLVEDANVDQAPVNPPPLTDGDIRVALIKLAQASTIQAQATTAQANRELVPRPHQQVTTMTSRQKDFTRMNPPTF